MASASRWIRRKSDQVTKKSAVAPQSEVRVLEMALPSSTSPRVSIGPVAATIGILFWRWLWGVMGLLLAVPLTALVKLVADLHPSLCHVSNMLALTPRPTPRWVRYGETALGRAIPYLRGRPGMKSGGTG
jgi:hypothetical protein